MSNEGNWAQNLRDKQENYFGSYRHYYIGSTIGSTTAWTWFDFSGTNTGFGAANNLISNRIAITNSGTSVIQFSFNSGVTLGGELYGSFNAVTMDGATASGLWIRASAATQGFRLWAW